MITPSFLQVVAEMVAEKATVAEKDAVAEKAVVAETAAVADMAELGGGAGFVHKMAEEVQVDYHVLLVGPGLLLVLNVSLAPTVTIL